MLEALDDQRIIVGAYTDRKGGVCPMLAAHRRGGRTSLASFARAWDRYTGAKRPRPATEREVRALRAMLEASLMHAEADLATAIGEHRAATGSAPAAEPPTPTAAPPTDLDRSAELRDRPGWAWLRIFRRYDEWQAAVSKVQADAEPTVDERREIERV